MCPTRARFTGLPDGSCQPCEPGHYVQTQAPVGEGCQKCPVKDGVQQVARPPQFSGKDDVAGCMSCSEVEHAVVDDAGPSAGRFTPRSSAPRLVDATVHVDPLCQRLQHACSLWFKSFSTAGTACTALQAESASAQRGWRRKRRGGAVRCAACYAARAATTQRRAALART